MGRMTRLGLSPGNWACAGVETDIIDIAKLPLPTNDAGEAIKQANFSAKMSMRRIGYTTNTKPSPRT